MKQLRIYNQVFRIEKTVYSIQGISLPIPVSYRQLAFFIGALFVMLLLNTLPIFSLFGNFYLVKFIGIPAVVAWFFTRKTLDGKAPHRFLFRYFEHLITHNYFARYKKIAVKTNKEYSYTGEVAFRFDSGGDNR